MTAPDRRAAIDWHAHWIPPEIAEFFAARRTPPCLIEEGGQRFFYPVDGIRLPVKEHQLDIGRRLDEMDEAGVGMQVLSLAVFFGAGFDLMPRELEDEIVSANNEGLARLVNARPDRFAGFGLVPVHDPSRAAETLTRAVHELGLLGAVVPAEALGNPNKAAGFSDLFRAASDLRARIFVHPGAWRGEEAAGNGVDALIRRRAAGFQERMTRAALTLAFSDFLDDCPGAVVQLANLGGNMALLAERIANSADRMGLDDPRGKLDRLLYDTASFGPHGIALAAATLGQDRLVLGSDSPALPLVRAVGNLSGAPLGAGALKNILERRGDH